MTLTERHVVNRTNPMFKELDDLCFKSKNLYNSILYRIRQEYINNGKYLNYYSIQKEFQTTNNVDYRALPAKTAQQTMKLVDRSFKSFFALIKSYKVNKIKFKGCPKIPNYLNSKSGRFVTVFTYQGISKKILDTTGYIKLEKSNILIKTKVTYDKLCEVRIVPKGNWISIDVIYEVNEISLLPDNGKYAAIDLGVNNLMTVTTNIKHEQPIVYSGKCVKSWNRFYNKEVAKKKSKLKKGQYTSNKIKQLGQKREFKISDYFHKTSKDLVNYLVSRNINTLIIGNNQGWKQNTKLGKKVNQNFIQVPFYKLIQKLEYKCKLQGINVKIITEEYTSQCSFLDLENLHKRSLLKGKGKRISRGMYRTWKGRLINADVNGSFNILRKCKPNAFDGFTMGSNGLEGVVVHPLVKGNF